MSLVIIPQLIVGLGNPENKYEGTRHNIGFAAVEQIANKWNYSWQDNRRFTGLISEGIAPNKQKVRLLKPLTYMNLSGQSVRAVVDWYKYSPETVLVIYDDMDLPVGKMRMRLAGSDGGHNGMKSIIAHLGTQKFPRLRIGIGRGNKESINHVLGRFSQPQEQIISKVLAQTVDCIETSLFEGVEKAMSLYNNKIIEDSNQI
ncbi:MAG: aminoacyl-tRNA hydrolase [Cyanobacteriota bacterium ELA615]